jgi:hypothetical protein
MSYEPNRFVLVYVETRPKFHPLLGKTVRVSQRRTRIFTHSDNRVSPLQSANAACVKEGTVLVDVYPLSAGY